ncbi:hypothetical protein ACTFIW_012077 [Dictyostelium discoideum]
MANTAQCHLYTINNPRKALLHSKISSYNCRVVIITGPLVLPQDRRYAWHIFQALDIAKIEQATGYFIGIHEFLAYANENTKGAAAKNSIRTIYPLRIHREL